MLFEAERNLSFHDVRSRGRDLGSRGRPCPESVAESLSDHPVYVLYTYIFLDGPVVSACGNVVYTSRTYLSFMIDLSQAPETKVGGVCRGAYQYDAQTRSKTSLCVPFYVYYTCVSDVTIG